MCNIYICVCVCRVLANLWLVLGVEATVYRGAKNAHVRAQRTVATSRGAALKRHGSKQNLTALLYSAVGSKLKPAFPFRNKFSRLQPTCFSLTSSTFHPFLLWTLITSPRVFRGERRCLECPKAPVEAADGQTKRALARICLYRLRFRQTSADQDPALLGKLPTPQDTRIRVAKKT